MPSDAELTEPIDSDADPRVHAQRPELIRSRTPVLAVVSLGGGLGALSRYGITQLWPTVPGHIPWATLWTNLSGCFLIGILMVLITEVRGAHRLLRPFLGVGVLGGYTTFSTYAVEIRGLLRPDAVGVAFGYLTATLLGALIAVTLGVWFARWATRPARGGMS